MRALKARPSATNKAIAQSLRISPSTVFNARRDLALAKEERGEARKAVRETTKPVPTDRRERARGFLRDELADGPKQVSAVEEAAAKVHVDPTALEQARADLGVLVSRSNTGVQAVTWSSPVP